MSSRKQCTHDRSNPAIGYWKISGAWQGVRCRLCDRETNRTYRLRRAHFASDLIPEYLLDAPTVTLPIPPAGNYLVKLPPRPTWMTRAANADEARRIADTGRVMALIRRRGLPDAETTELISMLTGTS